MSAKAARAQMTIGDVLGLLRTEFPDVTISKIRFLEAEGLIEPERSPSGYRMFGRTDVERLRLILSAQRDHYLPLRVIKEHLEATDKGLDPPPLSRKRRGEASSTGPRTLIATDSVYDEPADVRLTRRQLLDAAGIEDERLTELEDFRLVQRSGRHYDGSAVTIAKAAAALASFGVEARHLRAVKSAAEREVGLIEQVVAPVMRQRSPGAHARAGDLANEIAALSMTLHAALVSVGLRDSINP